MRYLISSMLVVVAFIHLMPLPGISGAARLTALYGIAVDEPNVEILMRHRAVLFGLLGAFLLLAAFRPQLHGIALVAGFVSVSSFLYLAWSVGGYNAHVGRVYVADLVALACLVVGAVAHVYVSRQA